MQSEEHGVNIAGFFTAEMGLGEVARSYVRALRHIGSALSLQDASFIANQVSRKVDDLIFNRDNPYPINLVCLNPPEIEQFVTAFDERYFFTKYNIGSWWWEVEKLPESWRKELHRFDELWVGSEFIRQNFLNSAVSLPVIVVPPYVVTKPSDFSRPHFTLSDREFIFLFVFDFFSSFERKNPLAVIESFKKAFPNEENVRLVIKSSNGERFPHELQKLQAACSQANITHIDRCITKSELSALINCCDCYVSLHRSEGFGLPIAEAMFLEKPVITTAWSGNMDFTNAENSLLVQHDFCVNQEDSGPYKKGIRWADPDIGQAAQFMRLVFNDRDYAKTIAARGALTIQNKYGLDAVSQCISDRLRAIAPKVKRVQELAQFKNALIESKRIYGAPLTLRSEQNLRSSGCTSDQAKKIVPSNITQVSAIHGTIGVPPETSEINDRAVLGYTDLLVNELERIARKWRHSPIVGWPLRFFSACFDRLILSALSGEPARIIKDRAIDETFEGIASLSKADADRIAALESRIAALERKEKESQSPLNRS